MNDQTRVALDDSELAAFVQKLELWAQGLPQKERAFLEQMLADAADAANDDASGFANLSSLVGDDVGGYASLPGGVVRRSVAGYAGGLSDPAEGFAPNAFDQAW